MVINLLPNAEPHTWSEEGKIENRLQVSSTLERDCSLRYRFWVTCRHQTEAKRVVTYLLSHNSWPSILFLVFYAKGLFLQKRKMCMSMSTYVYIYLFSFFVVTEGKIVKEKNTYSRGQSTFYLFGELGLVIPLWSFL